MKIFKYLVLLVLPLGVAGQNSCTETIAFMDFTLEIMDFKSEMPQLPSSTDPLSSDTVSISENPCEDDGYYISGKTIRFIPKKQGLKCSVSYSLHATIRQFLDPTIENRVDTGIYESYSYSTAYFQMPVSGDSGFIVPEQVNVEASEVEIRNLYNMRDTSFLVIGEMPYHIRFSRDNKFFTLDWEYLYLRADLTLGNEFLRSKILVIGLSEGCD